VLRDTARTAVFRLACAVFTRRLVDRGAPLGEAFAKVWDCNKRAFRWLFQNKPHAWGIAYFCTIIAFGLFYLFGIPNSFYAPYAQNDPDLTEDRLALTETIQAAVRRAYELDYKNALQLKYPPDGIIPSGASTELPTAEHLFVETSKDGAQLVFTISWLGPSPYLRGSVPHLYPMITMIIKKVVLSARNEPLVEIAVDEKPYLLSPRQDVKAEGQSFFDAMFREGPEKHLAVSANEATKITRYLHGVQGRTNDFSNNVVRTIYFSVVVQTTLGLGDLLPMTTGARAAVGLQAILGIVIAGFFINSAWRGQK
jgi:Ion channel